MLAMLSIENTGGSFWHNCEHTEPLLDNQALYLIALTAERTLCYRF
jgi:hypothetical protein